MPLGDEKHQQIYEALVNLLGEDFVEDDPAVVEAFSRESQTPAIMTRSRVELIVLPGSTEDIQKIVRLANELKFPYSVTSTGLQLLTCAAVEGFPYWVLIDPKRMNHFTIDPDNMYAVVEPYVTIAQVQAEAMKFGLFTPVTGAGSQGSALATNLSTNTHWTGWRTGKGRNLLGMEWVLPTGEIVKTGSLANPAGNYAWGEGPGIDARGLLRSTLGAMGTLGIITRAAVKLHTWPGPPVWPTAGVQPEKTVPLSTDIFRTYFVSYPTMESCVEAVRELAEAEIGGVVMQVNPFDLVGLSVRSREEFWEKWHEPFWQDQIHHRHIIFITLWGYAGKAQTDYEELVLRDIVKDTGGEFYPEDVSDWLRIEVTPAGVRDTHRTRYIRVGAVAGSDVLSVAESLYDVLRSIPVGNAVKAKYNPPLGDNGLNDSGANQHKFWAADFGRIVSVGVSGFGEKTAECDTIQENIRRDVVKYNRENGILDVGFTYEASRTGPDFANIHFLMANLKEALDPNYLANPSRLINLKRMAKIRAEAARSPETK